MSIFTPSSLPHHRCNGERLPDATSTALCSTHFQGLQFNLTANLIWGRCEEVHFFCWVMPYQKSHTNESSKCIRATINCYVP